MITLAIHQLMDLIVVSKINIILYNIYKRHPFIEIFFFINWTLTPFVKMIYNLKLASQ